MIKEYPNQDRKESTYNDVLENKFPCTDITSEVLSSITQKSYNFVNVDKGRIIESLMQIVSSATSIKTLHIFDETGSTNVIADKAPYSGNTVSHPMYLSNPTSGVTVSASAQRPSVNGTAPFLPLFSCVHSIEATSDLSFTLAPFSLVYMLKMNTPEAQRTMMGKVISITGSELREYWLYYSADASVSFRLFDETTDGYIGRNTATGALSNYTWHTIIATYNGGNVSSGCSIYVNGIVADTISAPSGTFNNMVSTTAALGSYNISTTGVTSNYSGNYNGPALTAVIAEQLTANQCKRIDALLRSWAGVKI